MATEKQIKANRENAKRSTGPKSLAGRIKSSRNALRHGLSSLTTDDGPVGTQTYSLAQLFTPEGASQLQRLAGLEIAQAQSRLLRVAAVRKVLLAELNLDTMFLEQVKRLAALERYESRANSQRRRAMGELRDAEAMDGGAEEACAKVGKTNPIGDQRH